MVEHGWLAKPRVFSWPDARSRKGQGPELRPRMGGYILGQTARALGDRVASGDAVSHYHHRLHPDTAICLCCTIEHAEQMACAFRAAGIRAASLSGGTPAEERQRLIAGLSTGEVEVLSSCMIISEGTDIPSVGGAILRRPTVSLSLDLQMVGGPCVPRQARARRRSSIPIKDCPVGFCSCPSAAQVFPDCGHLFMADEREEQQLQRKQERGNKPDWAKQVWAARQRST